jgi:hypothetical protein
LRVSSESARARRSTKTTALDCAECSAAVFVSSARNYTASARGGYSARAVKKSVILALRYFSAAAGDALKTIDLVRGVKFGVQQALDTRTLKKIDVLLYLTRHMLGVDCSVHFTLLACKEPTARKI